MKKFWKFALFVAGTAVIALAGCGGGGNEDNGDNGDGGNGGDSFTLQTVQDAYRAIEGATQIGQSIEIKSGMLVQYSEEKEYVLSSGAYTVTGSAKRLNALDSESEDAYTETPISYTVAKAEAFEGAFHIDGTYFENVATAGSTLTAKVKAGQEHNFLGFETSAEVASMTVSFTLQGEKLGEIAIAYLSGECNVAIKVQFTY